MTKEQLESIITEQKNIIANANRKIYNATMEYRNSLYRHDIFWHCWLY